jgi:Glucose/sorbosone dehydrogenases
MAFDAKQQLWVAEMGPKGGDELNLVQRGKNYGYPHVSNGDHYDDQPIPDHHTRPEFEAPAISWTPVISPSSLMFYQGQSSPCGKIKR